jgi:hypothetical protein
MNRPIKAKINLSKVDKTLLFKGEKGTYLDLVIWIKDEPDQYGYDVSIQQETKKDEPKIYIGNGKTWKPKEANSAPLPDKQGTYQGKKTTGAMSNVDDLPGATDEEQGRYKDELSDLPF